MHAYDIVSGNWRYLKWQHTWWSGVYSIMLTKASILHRDYLTSFSSGSLLPTEFLEHIDKTRNCEDIAMAYVVAAKSRTPPVWVKSIVYEVSKGGISSGQSHFIDRSKCLAVLDHMVRKKHKKAVSWVVGRQKAVNLLAPWTRWTSTVQIFTVVIRHWFFGDE